MLEPAVEEEPVPVAAEGAAAGPEVITEKKPAEGEAPAAAAAGWCEGSGSEDAAAERSEEVVFERARVVPSS